MRLIFWLPLALMVGLGCSHQPKAQNPEDKAVAAPSTPTPAAPAKTAVPTKTKSEKETHVTTEATQEGKVTCSVHGDVRILDLRRKDGGCELGYTKNGTESIVANSGNGLTYCEKTLDKIKERLVGAGFECK
jgi:hypothetical protein